MGIIYILRNRKNDKCYIGQTTQTFKKRFRSHQHSNSLTGKAIQKYGSDNFDKLLLESVPEKELDYWETHYIQECNSIFPNGYNFESGGHKNKHLHKEHKRKISEANRKRTHSEESKRKMSKAHEGKTHSEETIKKMSELQKKNGNGMLGKHHSEESKKKMSEAKIGEENNMFGKHHSEETKQKIKEKRKLQVFSEETRKKISEANRKRKKIKLA
jgi:hypothetical protein